MSGKSRYKMYSAMFFKVAGFDDWNSEVHPKAVSAAMYPTPKKRINADPKTS